MELPLQITFRNIPPSPAIEANIREKAARLDRFSARAIGQRLASATPLRAMSRAASDAGPRTSEAAERLWRGTQF